jgi:hypothetical protein
MTAFIIQADYSSLHLMTLHILKKASVTEMGGYPSAIKVLHCGDGKIIFIHLIFAY